MAQVNYSGNDAVRESFCPAKQRISKTAYIF